jgi:ABC-type lipoprotein export system ATPase subunit
MALFRTLNTEGITIVMVTHNPDLIPCATHIYAMDRGRVVKNPDPALCRGGIPLTPADLERDRS